MKQQGFHTALRCTRALKRGEEEGREEERGREW
jgi:hypothetical protein